MRGLPMTAGKFAGFAILMVFWHMALAGAGRAQGWAEKMFQQGTAHDFGVVPKGSQLLFRFPITNIYAVRMEIVQIQPGCGCVSAVASKRFQYGAFVRLDRTLKNHQASRRDVQLLQNAATGTNRQIFYIQCPACISLCSRVLRAEFAQECLEACVGVVGGRHGLQRGGQVPQWVPRSIRETGKRSNCDTST